MSKENPIAIPITFFTQYVSEEKLWYVHSSFDIVNGTGGTQEEALTNHLEIINSKHSSEKYEDLMSRNDRIKIKKYILIAS